MHDRWAIELAYGHESELLLLRNLRYDYVRPLEDVDLTRPTSQTFPRASGDYFLPSIIMIWYPNPVLTSTYFGFAVVLASRLKAASSNVGSKSPLFFHPKAPPEFVN